MSAERLIANLLRVAREDLDGARVLAAAKNRNAIYLCEQSAEKVIRAVLTSEGQHAGIKHHLDQMVDLVPDANPLKSELREIEYLAAYATTYRYPTAEGRIKPAPSQDALEEAIAKIGVALDAAAAAHVVDLSRRDVPAGNAGPHRRSRWSSCAPERRDARCDRSRLPRTPRGPIAIVQLLEPIDVVVGRARIPGFGLDRRISVVLVAGAPPRSTDGRATTPAIRESREMELTSGRPTAVGDRGPV